MKISPILLLLVLWLAACQTPSSKSYINEEKTPKDQVLRDATVSNQTTHETSLPVQEISLQKKQTDTVLFKECNDDGDYFLFIVTQGKEEIALRYNDDILNRNDFVRGDQVVIEWELDSMSNAGDDEVLELVKRLRVAQKIKSGKVSQFRKAHDKAITYVSKTAINNYSAHFIDQVYTIVEYVVANSGAETVQRVLHTPKARLFYSIAEVEKANNMYYVFHIFCKLDGQVQDIQQIYQDVERATLYEYDPVTDALIAID